MHIHFREQQLELIARAPYTNNIIICVTVSGRNGTKRRLSLNKSIKSSFVKLSHTQMSSQCEAWYFGKNQNTYILHKSRKKNTDLNRIHFKNVRFLEMLLNYFLSWVLFIVYGTPKLFVSQYIFIFDLCDDIFDVNFNDVKKLKFHERRKSWTFAGETSTANWLYLMVA